jgi:phosphoglycolate phosphatase-like HAD superfamily hydrolase
VATAQICALRHKGLIDALHRPSHGGGIIFQQMRKKINAVVFDMDGVLIDAKEWHYDALNKALQLFGFTISRYDHLVTFDGLPTRTKLEMLSREQGLPFELHELINDLKNLLKA